MSLSACGLCLSVYVPLASFFWRITMAQSRVSQVTRRYEVSSWCRAQGQRHSSQAGCWTESRTIFFFASCHTGGVKPCVDDVTEAARFAMTELKTRAAVNSFFFFYNSESSALAYLCFKVAGAHIVLFCCTLPSAVTKPWTQGHNPPPLSVPASLCSWSEYMPPFRSVERTHKHLNLICR